MARDGVTTFQGERALAVTVVSVGASATIQALLAAAGVTIDPRANTITLVPAGPVFIAIGEPATAAKAPLATGVGYEFGARPDTDVRLYAAGATNVSVWQEG